MTACAMEQPMLQSHVCLTFEAINEVAPHAFQL